MYEGEILNGERNGKGKEYYYGYSSIFGNTSGHKLKFEGDYLKGKKWNGKGFDKKGNVTYELNNGCGIVKEYYDNGNLEYEEEYLNGESNGKIKEYDFNGDLIFIGEYKDNKRWNGIEKKYVNIHKLKYEREYINGEKKGMFKEYENGKLIFEGEHLNGKKWNGKEYDSEGNVIYELTDGKGSVKEYYENGNLKYEGEYLNGERKKKFCLFGNLFGNNDFDEAKNLNQEQPLFGFFKK